MSVRDELISFAEQAAHDLNNTVAAISMALELALDELPEADDELASLLDHARGCADRLAKSVAALPTAAADWSLDD